MMKSIDTNPELCHPDDARAWSISALMDGAISDQDTDAMLAAAAQPEGQERWQLYHLIGDTLRSADLAEHHDAELLANIRLAMRQGTTPTQASMPESVPLPVAFQPAANESLLRWKLASGFASVIAVVAIGWNLWSFASTGQQLAQNQSVRPSLAQSQANASVASEIGISAGAVAPGAQRLTLDSSSGEPPIWRDQRLDRLLAAHRRMVAFGGNTSAFLRNATFEEPQR
jgi:sigma-E factor negative regulatory protein RseA